MKKDLKKGFTIVELLAVILILGVLITLVATSAVRAKKKAAYEEAKKIARSINDLIPGIYSYEKLVGKGNRNLLDYWNSGWVITFEELIGKGYIEGNSLGKIVSPYSSKHTCEGQVVGMPDQVVGTSDITKVNTRVYIICNEDNLKFWYDSVTNAYKRAEEFIGVSFDNYYNSAKNDYKKITLTPTDNTK